MARIFISYSHKNEAWKDRVVKQLGVLADDLSVWDDRKITAGYSWQPEIEQAIAECHVALLLISADFLNSPFILGKEVPPLLQRRREQGIYVIPIILSPCQWTRIPWLMTIQARPKDGNPLSGMNEHDAEVALSTLAGEIHDLHGYLPPDHHPGAPVPPEKIDLTHLPAGAEHFLGRAAELAALDTAWGNARHTYIVELIAPGGTGKTALVKRWLDNLKINGWRGAKRAFAWSFFSQGTGDKRQASEDQFLAEALKWFGVELDQALDPWDKGRALGEAVAGTRTLLVLDGIEPLQFPSGPMAGELKAPGLLALLTHLASAGQAGMCVVTSREFLKDLSEWVHGEHRPDGAVLRIDLGNLGDADGARLLYDLGVRRAGSADISADDIELVAASREVRGHALTLSLLGRYLALAQEGNIRRRDQVDFEEADTDIDGGHAFKVMAAYETWFLREGKAGERELALLRLLGFFDRPAPIPQLQVLRTAPAITGLTEPLVGLNTGQWRIALNHLRAGGIVFPGEGFDDIDTHPLVRKFLAATLRKRQPDAWREGHRRLYEHLKASVPYQPEDLADLLPLYQAVAHGCLAGLYEVARTEVYRDRILRGTGQFGTSYSTKMLGANSNDLVAVTCFFEEPWQRPHHALPASSKSLLLNLAAIRLMALGRLYEALEPTKAASELSVKFADWRNTAADLVLLSILQLTLGQIVVAISDAKKALHFAERSTTPFASLVARASLANALQQHAETDLAAVHFSEAEALQRKEQSVALYSVRGFYYCDLLLAEVEQAAWYKHVSSAALITRSEEVAERASQALEIAVRESLLIDMALNRLTLARCAFFKAQLQGQPPDAGAQLEIDTAVAGLRTAGNQMYLPCGLVTRAWLRHCLGDDPGARADLDEAERIARRGGMRLHLADLHLTRARLFHDRDELAKARALIMECEYFRRLGELEDAEEMLGVGG